jgi:hypothetical protein
VDESKKVDEVIVNADSKGFMLDYLNSTSLKRGNLGVMGQSPDFDPRKALTLIKNDPLVRACLTTIVDKVLETKWWVKGRNKKTRTKELEIRLKDVRFNRVFRKLLFNLVLYNNAFLEIVRKEKPFSDLNVLETIFMKIDAQSNGDVVGYYQETGGPGIKPYWFEKDVVHFKLDEITTNTWSDLTIEALYETVLIKDYVRQWLMWFFGTNQMRGFYNIKNANTTKVKDFLSYLKASEKDKSKPIIAEGEVTYQILNSFATEGQTLREMLDWCDEQILVLLQVPPIAVGKPDSSGRSNSVEQYQALNTRVLAIQRIVEEVTSYDLFPKIGYDSNDFVFGVLDESVRMHVFETAKIMKDMMMTDDAISEYLESQGVVFETKDLFKSPEELAGLSNKDVGFGNESAIGNKSHGSAPSREGQKGNSISKANKSVMVKNAESKFESYPYVFEVSDND